ncbi:MAG: hypothetical protein ACR2GY_11100 [Phycisphaerales bacterium]
MRSKSKHLDELTHKAGKALVATNYFDAERIALRAVILARSAGDFDRLARLCLPLQEARRQRLMQAFDAAAGKVTVLDEKVVVDDLHVTPGCYLVQPMLVGADARRLRLRALEEQVPVAVLCREPISQMGLQPMVAVGEQTIRVQIRPAKDRAQPSLEWFIDALEQLGDAAIQQIDPARQGDRLVDVYLRLLDAHPDHEKLHQGLADAARAAALLTSAA